MCTLSLYRMDPYYSQHSHIHSHTCFVLTWNCWKFDFGDRLCPGLGAISASNIICRVTFQADLQIVHFLAVRMDTQTRTTSVDTFTCIMQLCHRIIYYLTRNSIRNLFANRINYYYFIASYLCHRLEFIEFSIDSSVGSVSYLFELISLAANSSYGRNSRPDNVVMILIWWNKTVSCRTTSIVQSFCQPSIVSLVRLFAFIDIRSQFNSLNFVYVCVAVPSISLWNQSIV